MDGENAGLNLHTREVNREPSVGLLANFTAMLKETRVMSQKFHVVVVGIYNSCLFDQHLPKLQ